MATESLNEHVTELQSLIIAHIGEPEELYSLVYDGYAVLEISDAEDDDGPPPRVLCPPVSERDVTAAEAVLGFQLPPLLRSVYTRVGNGGLCLRLLGLQGGKTGGYDLFPGMSAVEIYQEIERWRQAGKAPHVPPRLLPIEDDLGCGMVDFVDCRTPESKIWRSDSGTLLPREPTLMDYLRQAIEGYQALVQRPA